MAQVLKFLVYKPCKFTKKGGNYIKGSKGKVTMSLDGNMGKVIDPGDALGACFSGKKLILNQKSIGTKIYPTKKINKKYICCIRDSLCVSVY